MGTSRFLYTQENSPPPATCPTGSKLVKLLKTCDCGTSNLDRKLFPDANPSETATIGLATTLVPVRRALFPYSGASKASTFSLIRESVSPVDLQ